MLLSILITGLFNVVSLKLSDITSILCKSTVLWTLYLITNKYCKFYYFFNFKIETDGFQSRNKLQFKLDSRTIIGKISRNEACIEFITVFGNPNKKFPMKPLIIPKVDPTVFLIRASIVLIRNRSATNPYDPDVWSGSRS